MSSEKCLVWLEDGFDSSSVSKIRVQRAVMAQLRAGSPRWPLPAMLALDTVPSATGMILVVARGSRRMGHGWSSREFGTFPWDGVSGKLGSSHEVFKQKRPQRQTGELLYEGEKGWRAGEELVLKDVLEKGVRAETTAWNRHLTVDHQWPFLAMPPASFQDFLEQAIPTGVFPESWQPAVAHCTEGNFFFPP